MEARYWIVKCNGDSQGDYETIVANLEFRTSHGGADVTTGGIPIQSGGANEGGGTNEALAFDDDANTGWQSYTQGYIGYDFGAGNSKTIVEVAIMASAANPELAPYNFQIRAAVDGAADISIYSNDWVEILYPPNEDTWTSGETKLYSLAPNTGVVVDEGAGISSHAASAWPGGHSYWRIFVNETFGNNTSLRINNLIMREEVGGVGNFDLQGTASATDLDAGMLAEYIFENTGWRATTLGGSRSWTYYFGEGDERDLKEITFSNTDFVEASPKLFEVSYSDDNNSWIPKGSYTGENPWSAFETRTFLLNGNNNTVNEDINVLLSWIITPSRFVEIVSEIFNLEGGAAPSKERVIQIVENISAIANIVETSLFTVLEGLSVTSDSIETGVLNSEITEDIMLSGLIRVAYLVYAAETLTATDINHITINYSEELTETTLSNLSLLSNLVANGDNLLSIIGASDSVARPVLGLITEAMDVSSPLLPLLLAYNTSSENIDLVVDVYNDILVRASLADVVSLAASVSLQAMLNEKMEEYVVFNISGVDLDDDSYYGWTYNPETSAVTNYNLNFSEAVTYNQNTYLANSSGLYLFKGNKDAGEYIQSKVTTAGLTFGKRTEKQVPQLFLGVGGTNHIISVSVDEQETVYYELSNQTDDGLTTKNLKIGKGLIGNTWQFSITDKEQLDFDLDSLEFYPVFLKRKHR